MHGRRDIKLRCTPDLTYTTAGKIGHMTSKGKFVSVPLNNLQRSHILLGFIEQYK